MADEDKRLRADAERNRHKLLEAARALFTERGLDVGVGEIAERAGVGRGTLFRNFPSKEHLIAAIVAEGMRDGTERGNELLQRPDAGAALFEFMELMAGRQQVNRALFEAVAPEFLANEEIRQAHDDVIAVLDQLLDRAKQSGVVREDIGAFDLLILLKGVCEVAAMLSEVNPEIVERQLGLVRAAISAPGATEPLRGRPLTAADLERASISGAPPAPAKSARA